MVRKIKIKRGLDIPFEGKASGRLETVTPSLIGLCPDDFPGHVWKSCVKEGDKVSMGSPLFQDKATGLIKIVSPLKGTVGEVRRGERRKILAITVRPEANEIEPQVYDLGLETDKIRHTLLESGLWAMLRQRPFDIVPDPDSSPRDIFVSAFDSAPLAPELFDQNNIPFIEKGLEILTVFAGKKPYIATSASNPYEFKNGENLIMEGPHPAGNVGVQIAGVAPVNKGETVWALTVSSVFRIGKLYTDGVTSWKTHVALTGPEMPDPHSVQTIIGVAIHQLLPSGFNAEGLRVISGNVLTGRKVDPQSGFLHYPYRQLTVIREGDNADEFMGWASISPDKFSTKRTFPAFLKGLAKPFPFDARIKGGRRAMILSGEFDKVFPFDIYPEYLLRAINNGDIDRMEKLGIYEVAPEDFALPEFVDTSKHELQQMVRDALDNLRAEG